MRLMIDEIGFRNTREVVDFMLEAEDEETEGVIRER